MPIRISALSFSQPGLADADDGLDAIRDLQLGEDGETWLRTVLRFGRRRAANAPYASARSEVSGSVWKRCIVAWCSLSNSAMAEVGALPTRSHTVLGG